MKVRIIQKPEYMILCAVQVKRWWFSPWVEVCNGDLKECTKYYDNLMSHGEVFTIHKEGETEK